MLNVFLYGAIYLFYKRVNKRRDRIWNSRTAKVSNLYCEPVMAHALSMIADRIRRSNTSIWRRPRTRYAASDQKCQTLSRYLIVAFAGKRPDELPIRVLIDVCDYDIHDTIKCSLTIKTAMLSSN